MKKILSSILILYCSISFSQEPSRSFELGSATEPMAETYIVPMGKIWVLKKIEIIVILSIEIPGKTSLLITGESNGASFKMQFSVEGDENKILIFTEGPLYFHPGTQINIVAIVAGYYAFFDEFRFSDFD